MAFNTQITTVNTLEFILSANASNNIIWRPYTVASVSNGLEYTSNTSIVSATYINYPGVPVTWGVASVNPSTNFISVTAFSDSNVIAISGIHSTGSESEIFYPYYIDQATTYNTQLTASVSAFYRQVSTSNILPITGEEINWHIIPTFTYLSAGLSGDGDEHNLNLSSNISGYTPSASKITFAYAGTALDVEFYSLPTIINSKYINSPLSANFSLYDSQYKTVLNPSIQATIDTEQSTYVTLSATQIGNIVSDDTILKWNTNRPSTMIGLTGASLSSTYTFGQSALSANRILLSATDLSYSYVYTLSSYANVDTGIFRPYKTLVETSALSSRIIRMPDEINTYKYDIQGLGITDGILHIIDPFQYIRWECSDPIHATAKYSNDTTSYSFSSIGVASNIDNLIIRIVPTIVSNTPQLCTVSFQLCALSGSRVSDGIFNVHRFDITYSEWMDEAYFNPKFRFQYETEDQNIIYRPTSAGTKTYSISNTSILPTNTFGSIIFTFSDGICSIPYDITNGGLPPSGVSYTFNTANECICSISMGVYASGAGYDDYIYREADTKSIVFADVPSASSFIVYPEYNWNGTSWDQVVSSQATNEGEILIPTAALSAYSICHTENFFLSSEAAGIDRYTWSIQDINDTTNQEQTTTSTATGWITFKTGASSTYLSVCAVVYTSILSSDMPSMYYDVPSGVRFDNFATTYDTVTSTHKQHIRLIGVDSFAAQVTLQNINYSQLPAPNILYLTGSYVPMDADSLFTSYINNIYFDLSSIYWDAREAAKYIGNSIASTDVYVSVDNTGSSYIGVPKNEATKIKITPEINYILQMKVAHPSASDWCLDNITYIDDTNSAIITAFPVTPTVYTPNKYVTVDTDVVYSNTATCFSGISSFTWTDRDTSHLKLNCNPYITYYTTSGNYDLDLSCVYFLGTAAQNISNSFNGILNVQSEYSQYDSDITRIVNVSKLALPNDLNECKVPPNEWMVADTFNAAIKKLSDNLEYLDDMSNVYDIPPTEYIGWYGTLYYANSVERTKWFSNIPQNSYAYDHPEYAIEGMFNNLQSVAVKNNTMYVSNGTSLYILSSDIWGTVISERTQKTLGDDFISIRSVQLDSENRIYVLDSYDSNNIVAGSKNRIIVYTFDTRTSQWRLMYEWGSLGGRDAKNKFNNPSDLYVDTNDTLWVADTDNKCVKKYTRTGSWLATITSSYFTDTEKPLSVVLEDSNSYVLTNSQVVKFNSNNEAEGVYTIPLGAIKIRPCRDSGFFYIVYTDSILKFAVNGDNAGTFAQSEFTSYTEDYRDVYHDEFRNLYIVNRTHMLKYVDLLSTVTLKSETASDLWPIEQLQVQKDEYIQDWVVNRCFQRLWDNIEIFRRNINGKFGYQTLRNTTRVSMISTVTAPVDFDYCNYDWYYDRKIQIDEDIIYEYEKPIIRTFTIDEYKTLPYSKEQIFIGINEIHLSDVYNRAITKLFECEDILLQMISD